MKDQNTPTNTLEEIEKILPRTHCPPGCDGHGTYAEADSDGDAIPAPCQWCFEVVIPLRKSLQKLLAQAVNKANEEAEYWRKRAARWKKEVEELDGKLMDIELNRDETPKGDK